MLKFLEPFFGFNTTSTTAFREQLLTVIDQLTNNSTFSSGRFPGVAALYCSSAYQGYNSIGTKSFSYGGEILRMSIDMLNTTLDADKNVFYLSNSVPSTFDSLTSIFNRTGTFFGINHLANGRFVLRKGAVVLATSVSAFSSAVNWANIEVETKISAAGTFKLWVNNVLEIDYQGNLVGSVTGSANNVGFCAASMRISKIAIWDDTVTGDGFAGYLGDFRVVRMLPNGAGNSSESTVTGAATRHEAVDDEFRNANTDYVTLLPNAKDLYQYSDVTPDGPIISVVAQPSASLGGSGQISVKALCRSGGVEVESPKSPRLGTVSGVYGSISLTHGFGVDPATGLAWTQAGLNAAEFGVKAEV